MGQVSIDESFGLVEFAVFVRSAKTLGKLA